MVATLAQRGYGVIVRADVTVLNIYALQRDAMLLYDSGRVPVVAIKYLLSASSCAGQHAQPARGGTKDGSGLQGFLPHPNRQPLVKSRWTLGHK